MSGRPTVGALFAGYGGLEIAAHDVFGAEPAWFSEVDAAPSKILAHHWPDVRNLGDITKIRWADVEPVDIITGGSPCQDLSHAGKRAGMKAGTRSGLWASMCDAIETLRPSLVIWENVRGAYSAEADSAVEPCPICVGDRPGVTLRALGRVLGDLAELGYDAGWYGLRAADVGAPHGRFRVFVVAWPATDAGNGVHVQHRGGVAGSTTGGERWDSGADRGSADRDRGVPAWGSREWRDLTLLRTPTAQLAVNGGSQHPDKRKAGGHGPTLADEVEHLLPTPAVNDMGASYTPETWDAWTERMKAAHGNGNGHGASLSIEALRMLPTPTTTQRGPDANLDTREGAQANLHNEVLQMLPTPRATDGTKGGSNQRGSSGDLMLPSAVGVDFGQYAPAIARWETITRPAPAPTEPTGKGGAHRLSPAFVEWMMGLPLGHVTGVPGLSRNDQLKALGNGVVPQQAAAAIRRLLAAREQVAA